jgi:hypothetical protein
MFRVESREEVLQELRSMAEMGSNFYSSSGDLHRLAGVLRAADIFWNTSKK